MAGTNYQGIVAYVKDQQVDSFKLFHKVVEGQERERLISMNSPTREVIRAGDSISRFTGDNQQVVVETKPARQSVLMNFPDDPTTIDRFYRINLRGQEYIAGRLSQVIALEPRDNYRYTRLIWVDTGSHLPLKFDVLNDDGQSVEQMVFTTLNTSDPIADTDLEPSSKSISASPIAQINHRETQSVDSLGWLLKKVPDGFQIMSYSTLKRPPGGGLVEHILLSDGFSSVSVYIENKSGKNMSGTRKLGAINVDAVAVDGYLVTVIGEVPLSTVKLIANGVVRKHQSH